MESHYESLKIYESVLEYDMLLSSTNDWLGQQWEEKSQCQLFLQTLQFTNTLLWIPLDQAMILLRKSTPVMKTVQQWNLFGYSWNIMERIQVLSFDYYFLKKHHNEMQERRTFDVSVWFHI